MKSVRLATTRATVIVGILVSASVLGASIADAAPTDKTAAAKAPAAKTPSAAASLKSGEAKLDAGDAAAALADFTAADAAKPTPESAHFIGLSEDRLGHFHPAVAAYERFVAGAPATMAAEVEITRKRIDEIKAMPATVSVASTPAGAAVSVDGAAQLQVTPADMKLASGTHVLRLTADGYEAFEREIDVSYATTKSVSVELVAAPPPPPPPAPVVPAPVAAPPPAPMPMEPQESTWLTRRNVGFLTGAIAIVGVGLGTGFGIAALDNKKSFDRNPQLSTGNDGNELAVASDAAFGAAVALGITSAILIFTGDDAPASNATSTVGPCDAREPRCAPPLGRSDSRFRTLPARVPSFTSETHDDNFFSALLLAPFALSHSASSSSEWPAPRSPRRPAASLP